MREQFPRPSGHSSPTRLGASLTAALVCGLLLSACGGGGSGVINSPATTAPFTATFHVVNTAGMDVVGATVYLVPVGDIDMTPYDEADIRSGASENRDEPLEDAVRIHGATYLKGVSGPAGMTAIAAIPDARFFTFVAPSVGDAEHLPGGSGCRVSVDASTLAAAQPREIVLTTHPSPTATYLGASTCLVCHSDHANAKKHAHSLGFAVPGQMSALQDDSRYPTYRDGWNSFVPANAYTGGTPVWLSDFTPSRGFDKFVATTSAPMAPAVVYVKAWFWKDNADSKYKITLENLHPSAGTPGPGDPPNIWTVEVQLTYGGAVYKQRNLVAIQGRKGRYPLLQYQTQGDDSRFDRTRKQFRDYHLDWYWNDAAKTFRYPAANHAFEGNCAACHVTGFERYTDAGTGEALARGVPDAGGAFDLDGDGNPEEINNGCENCHGPGSEHLTWVGMGTGGPDAARYILRPDLLSPSREMQICGRCHDRVEGNGTVPNDEPLNSLNQMPPVGISRNDYLAAYTTRKGPKSSSMWSDEMHSKSHHQQYADMLKSSKYRNDRLLVTCTNCHDSHGDGPFEHHLRADPDDPVQGLCFTCHDKDLTQHMLTKTGATHKGNQTTCYFCHMANTAKSGSGLYGNLLAPPTGMIADEKTAYFQNDIASHLFGTIPKKTHPDVMSKDPIKAMPIPYTRSCGQPCHVTSNLQFKPLLPAGQFVAEKPAAK